MKTLTDLLNAMDDLANEKKAKTMQKYFKSGRGEYGEGDEFLGLTVPIQRLIAKDFYKELELNDIQELLNSNIHEHRLTAVLMLVLKYEKNKDSKFRNEIIKFYLKNTLRFNNWDLVDSGCYKILGHHAFNQNREDILYRLAESENLWEKRIAIVSTLHFIKNKTLSVVPEIVLINMNHPHDLMHKANGWMLREMGNVDEAMLLDFLDEYATQLPRTSLRYAIEKLDISLRQYYLKLRD